MKVELVFHTFPLCAVDGQPVDMKAVYGPAPSTEDQRAMLAEVGGPRAATADVYGRLQLEFPGATKERMHRELVGLFADMAASDSFVDGLWTLFERAAAAVL